MTDNVLKSAYAGMVLRQVASHAFRRNCQDVIFLQRKLSLNIDRLVSKENKVIEFPAKKYRQKKFSQYSQKESLENATQITPKIDQKVMHLPEIFKT